MITRGGNVHAHEKDTVRCGFDSFLALGLLDNKSSEWGKESAAKTENNMNSSFTASYPGRD